ncbi:hypothetical protein H2201_007144 [Coniosporium apollinis]|uniref:Uncharacterized protein n=2 Tax=Coniosporium TaxID=2810619 RepID=A0ABQ9NJQ9_9PEZI|nr:hypothetical protein H2199_000358 [Cladosporium sp. JES 115]KAJ9659886.1 hypothetical protein H2201_007144 [Coniosporium apollinis]
MAEPEGPEQDDHDRHDGGMSGWGLAIIVILILIALGALGWIIYGRLRARRLGIPPPSLNPFANRSTSTFPSPRTGGAFGWLSDKVRSLRNSRYASGAGYESTTSGTRGRSRLDPDEAWDTRVGTEADVYGPGGYYEEQELGLHPAAATDAGRGRSRNRELDERYDEETGRKPRLDPFGDTAERSDMSLRGVSPRPVDMDTSYHGGGGGGGHQAKGSKSSGGSLDNSPTERRSMFTENM